MNIKEIIDRISSTHMAEKKDIIAIIENNSNDEYFLNQLTTSENKYTVRTFISED